MSFHGEAEKPKREYNQVITIGLDGGDEKFSLVDVPVPPGVDARPYLKRARFNPTKADTLSGKTKQEKAVFQLIDDSNYLKQLFAGLFYYGREVQLEEGFSDGTVWHSRTLMKLTASNYKQNKDVFSLEARGRVLMIEEDIPVEADPIVNITFTNQNPAEIMEDIIQNQGSNNIAGAEFDTDQWTAMKNVRLRGYKMSRTLSKPTKKTKLLKELQELSQTAIFENENGKLSIARVVAPEPHETLKTLTDDDLLGSVRLDDGQADLLTRVVIYYGYDGSSEENDKSSYSSNFQAIDAAAESTGEFGVIKEKIIFCRWTVSDITARRIANGILQRQKGTPDVINIKLDLRHSDLLVDDVFDLETKDILNSAGAKKSKRWHVFSRKVDDMTVTIQARDTQYAVDKQYMWIQHNGRPDYGGASDLDKKHWYIGDASNKVGGGTVDGSYIQE